MLSSEVLNDVAHTRQHRRNKLAIQIAYTAIVILTLSVVISDSFNLDRQNKFVEKTRESVLDLDNRVKALESELRNIKNAN